LDHVLGNAWQVDAGEAWHGVGAMRRSGHGGRGAGPTVSVLAQSRCQKVDSVSRSSCPASRVVDLVGEVPNLVRAAAGLVPGVGEFRGGVADLVAGATAEYSARMSGFRGGGMSGLKNVRNRRNDALSRVRWDRFESLLAVYF